LTELLIHYCPCTLLSLKIGGGKGALTQDDDDNDDAEDNNQKTPAGDNSENVEELLSDWSLSVGTTGSALHPSRVLSQPSIETKEERIVKVQLKLELVRKLSLSFYFRFSSPCSLDH